MTLGLATVLLSGNADFVQAKHKAPETKKAEDFELTPETPEQTKLYNETDDGLKKIYKEKRKEYIDKVNKYLENVNKKMDNLDSKDKEKLKQFKQEFLESYSEQEKEFMKKLGWEEVVQDDILPNKKTLSIHLNSTSSQVSMRDNNLYYSNTNHAYRYSGSFDFTDYYGWDFDGDTRDLVSVRALNNINIQREQCTVYQSAYDYYADKWLYDLESGNYDSSKSPTTTGFTVSKRFENYNGVVFNVEDKGYYTGDMGDIKAIYDTDNGTVGVYFQKAGGVDSNKFFVDLEHNWREPSAIFSANLSGVNLTGSALTVNYSYVNKNYQVTTPGKSM